MVSESVIVFYISKFFTINGWNILRKAYRTLCYIYNIKVFLIPEAFKATFPRSTEKDLEQLVMEWFRFANVRKQKKESMLNPDIIISLNSFSVLINYFKYSYKCILHKLKLDYYKFFTN